MNAVGFLLLLLLKEGVQASQNHDQECPNSQKHLGKHCIELVHRKVSYADARKYCHSSGGKLLKLRRTDMLHAVLTLLEDGDNYWVAVAKHFRNHDRDNSHKRGHHISAKCPMVFKDSKHRWVHPPRCDDKIEFICSYRHKGAAESEDDEESEEAEEDEDPSSHPGSPTPKEPRGSDLTPADDPSPTTARPMTEAEEDEDPSSHPGSPTPKEPRGSDLTPADDPSPSTARPMTTLRSPTTKPSTTAFKHYKRSKVKRKRSSYSWCIYSSCYGANNYKASTKKPKSTKPPGTNTPPNFEALTPLPHGALNNMSLEEARKITSELVNRLQNVVNDIWAVSLVKAATNILTEITTSTVFLSPETQVNASNILAQLTERFSDIVYMSSDIEISNVTEVANSLFQSFDETIRGSLERNRNLTIYQTSQIFGSSLAAVDGLEYTLLSLRNNAPQEYSFMSSGSSLSLTRFNSSTLSTTQFGTGPPAVCTVNFPKSNAMQHITDNFDVLNVQILALTANPFRNLSEKEILGTVANIQLSTTENEIEVSNLDDDIEIILGRNESLISEMSKANLTKSKDLSLKINITSEDQTLVVIVQPEFPLPIVLYLAYQHKTNGSHFMDNISLPRDDSYTWVVPPEQLNGSGIYYITVNVSNQSIWNEKEILYFSVAMFSTQCVHWNELASNWSEHGCRVGGKSTFNQTHCLCNHLTFFGTTFFVMPHVVDLSDTLSLFANVSKNPVGLALLGALIGFYLIVVIWAWRKDKEDVKKVRVAILADNDAAQHFRYVIKVCTGHRKGAGTTSKVVVTLYGSEGQSDPHVLTDPEKEVFNRASVDVFLLKTRYLGELHSLRLWHSNSGKSPSWYVYRVSVIDLAAQKTWYFFCDCWLASDVADCQLDRIFPSASKGNIMSLRYLFFSGSVEKFLKDHLWLTVWTRCAWSPFTRVQRICCCMSLLFCSLVINIMFWNMQKDEDSVPGQFFITFTQIQVSFQSAMMLVPVNLLIVQMFQLIQVPIREVIIPQNKLRATLLPSPPSKEAVTEQLLKELGDIVDFLYKYVVQVLGEIPEKPAGSSSDPVLQHVETLSYIIQTFICVPGPNQENPERPIVMTPQQCLFLHRLYKVLDQLKFQVSSVDLSYVARPINYIQATNILYELQDLLRSQSVTGAPLPSSLTTSFPVAIQKRTRCSQMPKAFTYLCWFFLFAISAFSAYYMVLLSLDMTKEKATSWLISMLLSLAQSLFVLPPLKVLAQTVFLFRVLRRSNIEDNAEEQQLFGILSLLANRPDWELSGWRDQSNPVYQAPANKNTTSMKKQRIMERKLYTLIHNIIVHVLFLVVTMLMAYADKSPNEFVLYRAMQNSFSTTFSTIGSIQDFHRWSQESLLPNLYSEYPGFITDGNCFLVGPPRIRQIRSVSDAAEYNTEDTKNYGPGWTPFSGHESVDDRWRYHTENELGGYPLWAQLGTYSGGGYLVNLGMDSSSGSSIITQMINDNWLDAYTKAVFVEFNVYNANVNLFCIATFILETNLIGTFWTSVDLQIMRLYENPNEICSVQFVSSVIFIVILLYIIVLQILRLKTQKWSYFYSSENLLDLSILAISLCYTGVYVKRYVLSKRAMERYHQDHNRFVSLYETGAVDSAYGYGTAFLVALMTVKIWRLLSLNPNLHLIMTTLHKAWNEMGGFLFTILILLVAYSISCNLLFGWSIHSYRTFFDSIVTIIQLLIGIFNYDKVLDLDPIMGALLIFTCVILLVFVVLNIFFSALLDVFSKERRCPTHYEEKEIVDLLLVKLSGLFGLQKKQETPEDGSTDKEKTA